MSRFRLSRAGFIRNSAGAATLGLAACSGAQNAVVPTPANASSESIERNGGPFADTATAKPVVTPSPKPTATPKPPPFPNGSVSTGSRGPNSLPDSSRPAGQANTELPFDYVVVVMMENHSFDNYFGMLPLRGQPLADGFTFDKNGVPQNKTPLDGGYQHSFHLKGTCQPNGVTQSWGATRDQVNDGLMDGFAKTDSEAMGYWDESDIPFYYSLAKTFCVGNRAFCSATAQTYPNRRYLYSGTSGGEVTTSSGTFTQPAPANGTLMDVMAKYGVTFKDYFTDLPALAIIPQNLTKHKQNFAPVAEFFADCAAGTLPMVSFVDPEFGAVDDVGGSLFSGLQGIPDLPASIASQLPGLANKANAQGGDEENPQDIAIGELFVSKVVNAVMKSPLWPRTLLIWTYDEHGGYYDHVAPLGAVKPDNIPPNLSATDPKGEFNITGVRIPTVVVSPYSRPNSVSNVPHDHTSIIATIAAKWNLPALTYRDAQAHTLFDYLNFNGKPAFLDPPDLAAPAALAIVKGDCEGSPQAPIISKN